MSFDRNLISSWPEYAAAEGMTLTGRGKWRSVLCCFHDDRTPSMRVNVESGAWVCMSHVKGGDVLSHYMQRSGLGFVAAARMFGAIDDKGQPLRPQRRFSASDALDCIGAELNVCAVVIGDCRSGVLPSDADWQRFLAAAGRDPSARREQRRAVRAGRPDVPLVVLDRRLSVEEARRLSLALRPRGADRVVERVRPRAADHGRRRAVVADRRGPLGDDDVVVFQELVEATTIRELIDQGFLCDLDAFAPADPDLTGVKTQRGIGGELDYNEAQLAADVDKPALVGDIVSHWLRLAAGKPTVVFASNIAHSQHIVAEFQRAGVTAAHIDYHHDDDERAEILKGFNEGRFTVLSNSALLAEGWDAPHAEVMILARPTKSLIRYIQMVGRVLRPHPGKERELLLDHSGTVLRLCFATDDLPLELDDSTANKAGSRKEERKKSEPKPCLSCKFVRPAGVHACPQCQRCQ